MLARVTVGSLLAAVALFLWGWVFWGILPFSKTMVRPIPNGATVTKTLKENIPETGVYFYPIMPENATSESEQKAFQEAHLQGPLVQLYYHKEGVDPLTPAMMGSGFLHYWVSALLLGSLLALAAPSLSCYWSRMGFVFLTGLFAAFAIDLSSAIWFHHPWDYQLFAFGFDVSNWLLAGVILAAVVKPKVAVAV